jgi:hypothetical protein
LRPPQPAIGARHRHPAHLETAALRRRPARALPALQLPFYRSPARVKCALTYEHAATGRAAEIGRSFPFVLGTAATRCTPSPPPPPRSPTPPWTHPAHLPGTGLRAGVVGLWSRSERSLELEAVPAPRQRPRLLRLTSRGQLIGPRLHAQGSACCLSCRGLPSPPRALTRGVSLVLRFVGPTALFRSGQALAPHIRTCTAYNSHLRFFLEFCYPLWARHLLFRLVRRPRGLQS